ncbi:MAG: Nif11-like leader peptide family natural product precursor [Cyanobacteria bacterium]|nr:Nif11-like leader peptide family natural product precursor [Cyanobacteria bacterium bin.51]
MSKSQLNAFLAEVEGNQALKQRVDGAADPSAVVAIALESGHLFSEATLTRHLRV